MPYKERRLMMMITMTMHFMRMMQRQGQTIWYFQQNFKNILLYSATDLEFFFLNLEYHKLNYRQISVFERPRIFFNKNVHGLFSVCFDINSIGQFNSRNRGKKADFTLNLSIFCLGAQLSNFARVFCGRAIPMMLGYRFLPIINKARILSSGPLMRLVYTQTHQGCLFLFSRRVQINNGYH